MFLLFCRTWFLFTYMQFVSNIFILIEQEVEKQLRTLCYWLRFPSEYQWALRGAFEINHSTLLLADSRPALIFLSLSRYIVVVAYEWFCIIHASYSLAVTVDLQMTQMQSITGDSEPWWKEVGCERKCKLSVTESNLPATCFASKCQYLRQFLSLKGIFHLSEKKGGLCLKPNLPSKYLPLYKWLFPYTWGMSHLDFHV